MMKLITGITDKQAVELVEEFHIKENGKTPDIKKYDYYDSCHFIVNWVDSTDNYVLYHAPTYQYIIDSVLNKPKPEILAELHQDVEYIKEKLSELLKRLPTK